MRHRRLYAKPRKTARRCFRCDGLRPEPISAAQPPTAACANSPTATSRRFAARSETSTRSTCSSSTARWAAPPRHLPPVRLDRAGGAAAFGDVSHGVRSRRVRLSRDWFRADLQAQFRQGDRRCVSEYNRAHLLSAGIATRLRRAQRFKPVAVIVHTRRELWHMRYVHGLRNVYDHPLSFLSEDEADEIRRTASRDKFPLLDRVAERREARRGLRLYRALQRFRYRHPGLASPAEGLPSADFRRRPSQRNQAASADRSGRVVAVRRRLCRHQRRRADARRRGARHADGLGRRRQLDARPVDRAIPRICRSEFIFSAPPATPNFLSGMAVCDTVVFPYLEVGQSSSGPISQALELGCRVIASRTHTFLQFGRYHQGR